ncbi:MAG: prolipoprotein diacylglyceryl transferase [Armatimonadetes bacterium]|nr:prolipoprotein diacylglyceryl transferase [Armatimonadota bacterium]NIM24145.1 prolipoprotein diacylglyceryl transferase [Armatimonadota bacterium]NIM68004.1 prolipoprotein diacylglyceryl transferase [Armatimonadota bacterium]NIM76499.1 prolipoprotein diacylglyceryl transferase [Armatimonadota bacterium]NIN06238.1 prolipoprotein diacylglyceryl transferase [Armatimonadota bacterium]
MHPTLFRLGPISIHSYGAMLMIGFVAALLWARREAVRRGIEPVKIVDLSLWLLIFGLVFARVVFILLNLEYYRAEPLSSLFLAQGKFAIQGLSFHGGLAGAMLGGLFYASKAKLSWLTLADICAPAAALAYGFGRIGCFLNGCCYGAPTDLPWAVSFAVDPTATAWTPPSHPTQLYSALGSWAIFGLLLLIKGRVRGRGQLFFIYLALYSVMRFMVEILRSGHSAEIAFDSLTQAQVASAALFVISLLLVYCLRPKP